MCTCGHSGSTLKVMAQVDTKQVCCLIDSGATVSLINSRILSRTKFDTLEHESLPTALGANGTPLAVVGRIELSLTLGSFGTKQSFIVVNDLTVDCILGADFLFLHCAILDCAAKCLHLRTPCGGAVIQLFKEPHGICNVVLADDMVLKARHVSYIIGQVESCNELPCCRNREGLIEPILSTSIPSHVLCPCSLSLVDGSSQLMIEMINNSQESVKLYKGMKVATFTPMESVMIVDSTGGSTRSDCPEVDISELKIGSNNISQSQRKQLERLVLKYSSIFSTTGRPLGRTSVVKHNIITNGPPIRQKFRRIPEAIKPIVTQEVDKMLEGGIIRKSVSPWSSPIVLVKKKDGKWRFCIDFRKINAITHKDAYPLPKIEETLDALSGAKYFSTLDMASGYWQVELEEAAREKTAFSTPKGLFEFNVMPFGLTNAPATFQRLMECVLAGLSVEQCLIYLDDVIVFSHSFDEHLVRLENVFNKISNAGLTLKLEKCHFVKEEVKYLGHLVGSYGIKPDSEKLACILTYPTPADLKQLRQFLGFSGYYRRFIKNYARIAAPLYQLMKKTAKRFNWTTDCDQAFKELKNLLCSPPILSYPCFQLPFVLSTDASDRAIGAVLSQVKEGEEHPIAYWSRQLQKAEKNYSTIEREALAVVSAIKHFYPYLYGRKFILHTDHNPLTSLKGLKDVGGRLSRWQLYLQQFDMELQYKPGKSNSNADTMSRLPVNDSQVASIITFDLKDIQKFQESDKTISSIITAIKERKPLPCLSRQADRLFLRDGVLCRTYQPVSGSSVTQIVVPMECRQLVFRQLHDLGGHFGVGKTLAKVKERYYWPGYEQDIEKWVKECQSCQQRNPPHINPRAPLGTIAVNYPFEKVSWDITGPLPVTRDGYKYILVVTDLLVEAFPLCSTDSQTLATVLVDEVICRYGVPRSIHND